MSDYRRIYPSKDRVVLDGGKNNKFPLALLPDNESPDCANVVFTERAVETRQGVVKAHTSGIASARIDGLYTRATNTGVQTMIAFCNGSAFQYTAAATFTTIGSAQSVFTAGVRVAATNYENHLFVGNGFIIPYKWNGTDWTRHGVYPPASAPTAASAATGAALASGSVYSYKVTFVNSQLAESDVSPAVTHTIAANSMGNVALTSIPVAVQSWGIASRRLYRTAAGGATYKRLITISDNTTTTYQDGILDAALGVSAPTDNGVPPKYSVLCYHQDRLFMNDPANPNFVWYSNLGEPYTVASTNFRTIGDASGDYVRGLSVYEDSVLVSCSNSKFLIYMPSTDPTTWVNIRVESPYGTRSPFCLLDYENKKLFAAMQNDKFVGFAAVRGAAVEPSASLLSTASAGSDRKSDMIEPDMFLIQESLIGEVSGIIFKNKAWISVPFDSGALRNNRIYVADFSMSNLNRKEELAWVPFTGLSATQFTILDGSLYFGASQATGLVYRAEAGVYSDDGVAIDSYIWTKEFSGFDNEVNFTKDFRYANILVEKLGDYNMNLTYRSDSDMGSGTSVQVNLSPGGSLWGVMVWGVDPWGGGVSQEDKRVFLGTLRGKRVQFKFSNQNVINQRFKVHGLNFAYNLKGYR